MQLYLAIMSNFISRSAINLLHVLHKTPHLLLSCWMCLRSTAFDVLHCLESKAVQFGESRGPAGRRHGTSK